VALGCTHHEIAPGKTAYPFHFHSGIEEAVFVLEGNGRMRIGKEEVSVRAGDYVALPPGPNHAHALTNDGTTPLRYLCMSGPAAPQTLDVVGYPDSKKVAYVSGIQPGKSFRDGAWVLGIVKEAPPFEYYEDEPLAKD
jgi:uncharacterized cupin superfamily protein